MEYISRHMESRITELSKYYSVILLTGPRQSGKTTMLRRLAEKEGAGRRYVTLDDLGERELAKNDPDMFLQLHKPPVLIDEVQYAPELFGCIKSHVDRDQNPGDFWMTGSQIFRLMRGVQESLAGRVALLSLSSLSQREITGAACVPFTADADRLLADSRSIEPVDTPSLYARLWKGSMPGVIGGHTPDRNVFYSSYVSTYVERDVRRLSGGVDALRFNRFVTAVAARCSQLLNYNALAEDAGISVHTAKGWMDILETLGIVFLLQPYSNNVLKRAVKTPKVYFFDTGLVCYLTRWSSPEAAEAGAMNGALLENFAVSEILKGYRNAGLEPYLFFYRDRDAKEIDLVLESDGRLCPLEIKKTATPDKRLTRVFGVIDKSPLKRGTGAIICMAGHFGAIDRDALIVPVWML
ncbi:MAG: ATP-binding protein [Abditibacteriota bacterium]|nr:ATP-binding protein [Abditibacteriota bacterium]